MPPKTGEPTWLGTAVLAKAVGIYQVMVPTWLSINR
jgi:hypothetical protein